MPLEKTTMILGCLGEKGYSDTILSIETENARKRVKRQTQN